MMKNRKHEPILFSYRDCDDFAAYLEEQARLGWHFKEIHMGLVFERGEPAEIRYRVEVFPKRREEEQTGPPGRRRSMPPTARRRDGNLWEAYGNSASLSRWKGRQCPS